MKCLLKKKKKIIVHTLNLLREYYILNLESLSHLIMRLPGCQYQPFILVGIYIISKVVNELCVPVFKDIVGVTICRSSCKQNGEGIGCNSTLQMGPTFQFIIPLEKVHLGEDNI